MVLLLLGVRAGSAKKRRRQWPLDGFVSQSCALKGKRDKMKVIRSWLSHSLLIALHSMTCPDSAA